MRIAEYLIGGATLCLLLTTAAANAEPKEKQLEPLSKWRVDWEPQSCLLARQFGPEKHPFLLSFRTYAPGYTFQVTLAGKQIAPFRDRSDFAITYGNGTPIPVPGYQNGTAGTYGPAMIFSTTMADGPADEQNGNDVRPFPDTGFEKQLDRITVSSRARRLVIDTGPMASALNAMRKCTDDLATELGLDPGVQHGLTRTAQPVNLRVWASKIQAIYPSQLSYAGKGARLIVRVVVDKDGNPARCDFFQAFTNTDFSVKACDIINREAKFAPALSGKGTPVPSIFSTVIVYKLNY